MSQLFVACAGSAVALAEALGLGDALAVADAVTVTYSVSLTVTVFGLCACSEPLKATPASKPERSPKSSPTISPPPANIAALKVAHSP